MKLRTFRDHLRIIVFGTQTKAGKWFDIILLWAISLSILTVILESIDAIHARYVYELHIIEWFFTILFTLEYFTRIYITDAKSKYIFSPMGIIDLIAFLPTYLSLILTGGQYFMVIRGLRLLRVFRILKMVNYLKDVRLLLNALSHSFRKIGIFMFFILILVTILGSAMYLIESDESGFKDIPNSIYWAIVTLSTVGFGDITPVTPLGKVLASIIMLIGYGIIAVPTGIITHEMIKEGKKLKSNQNIVNPVCGSCEYIQPDLNAIFCSRCGTKLTNNQ
jgi:voltage-gated potassium channel